jgi:membrane protease YdiL (CAAX protease family)
MQNATSVDRPHLITQRRAFIVFLGSFYAVWSCWGVVLVHDPQTFGGGSARLLARLCLWIVPTVLFAAWSQPAPVVDFLRLRGNVCKGVLWGLAAAVVHPVVEAVYGLGWAAGTLTPLDWSDWANAALGAPLAEELLFRGVVLQRFAGAQPAGLPRNALAVAASAVLFSLIHLPYWWLSGTDAGWGLAAAEARIFCYGVVCAIVFLASGSLWSPLIYHWVNNILNLAVKVTP